MHYIYFHMEFFEFYKSFLKIIQKPIINFTIKRECFSVFGDFSEFWLVDSLSLNHWFLFTEGVVLCIIIGDVHQFICYCLISLDPWVFQRLRGRGVNAPLPPPHPQDVLAHNKMAKINTNFHVLTPGSKNLCEIIQNLTIHFKNMWK